MRSTFVGQVWIGFYQPNPIPECEPDLCWEWVSGEPITYIHWASGEPNNAGPEHWATLNPNGSWYDGQNEPSVKGIVEINQICGDGIIQGPEQCDSGIENGQECIPKYGSVCQYCDTICNEQTIQGPYCGDGIINGPEECDDSNDNGLDGCTNNCSIDADLDGIVDNNDNCDLYNPSQLDCQPNSIGDVCDIAYKTSQDCDINNIPDDCECIPYVSNCPYDLNCDGVVGPNDLALLLGSWGPCPYPCPADLAGTGDGLVSANDLAVLLGHWGPCK